MNSTNKIDKAKNCFCISGAIIEEKLILKKMLFLFYPLKWIMDILNRHM